MSIPKGIVGSDVYNWSRSAWYWLFSYVRMRAYPRALIRMCSIGGAGPQYELPVIWDTGIWK